MQFHSTGINGNYLVPEMIVVAITNTDRTKDLTPTNASKGQDGKELSFLNTSGGMTKFFKFLKNELIPHIDSGYHTSSYRILVGHSLEALLRLCVVHNARSIQCLCFY